ncbi:MAG TPA: hypothetical protein VHR66_17100 [Gemmataceae bacterium]|jgi:Cu/Ag efflux protein CusF|nr:hypothetical protein [Gemmataceae bacterium]
MLPRSILVVTVALLASSMASAETYGEKIKEVSAENNKITIPVDGKDREFDVDKMVEVKSQRRVGKRLTVTPVKDGLKGVKAGSEATITTEKRDGKEVVTKIVVLIPDPK